VEQTEGEAFDAIRKARMSGLEVDAGLSDVRVKTDDLGLGRGGETFDVGVEAEDLGVAQGAEAAFLTRYWKTRGYPASWKGKL